MVQENTRGQQKKYNEEFDLENLMKRDTFINNGKGQNKLKEVNITDPNIDRSLLIK